MCRLRSFGYPNPSISTQSNSSKFAELSGYMDPASVIALCALSIEVASHATQLYQSLRSSKSVSVTLDELVDQVRHFKFQTLRTLRGTMAGVYPESQRCHFPVDIKSHTLAHDLEQEKGRRKECDGLQFIQGNGSEEQGRCGGMKRLRLVRSLAGVLLLYPVCMLIMSNYALTRGLLQSCSRLESHPLGRQISLVPQFILRPSPLAFFLASTIWTVLEFVHYQGNAEDDFQKQALGGAAIVGLLPCIGCTSSVLGVLVSITPWFMHAGLLVSNILHSVWKQRSKAATMMVFPCVTLQTRP